MVVELGIDVVAAGDHVVAVLGAPAREPDHLGVEVGVGLLGQQRVLVSVEGDQGVLERAGFGHCLHPALERRVGAQPRGVGVSGVGVARRHLLGRG